MTIKSIIPNSNKVPGQYTRVSLGVGPRVGGAGANDVVLFGNKTSAGTMSVETEYEVFDEDEVRGLAGDGAELFWMFKFARAANPGASLFIIAVTESAGAAATGTITLAGTATSAGTIGVTVMGEEIEIPFADGDTATAAAAVVNTYIGYEGDWPVTSGAAAAVVTLTARNLGPRGNFLRFRVRIIDGTGLTVAASSTYLAGGATSDDPQNAIDVMDGVRRRFLVAPYSDATQLAKFKSHIDAQDEPLIGNRKVFVSGSLDTVANTTTLAIGLNFTRGQVAWLYNSDVPPSCLASSIAAYRAGEEQNDAATNFDGKNVAGMIPHWASSERPSASELDSALNNGVTPFASTRSGEVFIVRSVTTKSQDPNAKPDFRVLDTHKVAVPDFIAEDIELQIGDTFSGFKASQDPPEGQTPPVGVVTPAMVKDLVYARLRFHETENGLLDSGSVDANIDGLVFELSKVADGRFNGVVPLDVIELAHQFASDIRQIG
jgi:phage tail sheath gpL-like